MYHWQTKVEYSVFFIKTKRWKGFNFRKPGWGGGRGESITWNIVQYPENRFVSEKPKNPIRYDAALSFGEKDLHTDTHRHSRINRKVNVKFMCNCSQQNDPNITSE